MCSLWCSLYVLSECALFVWSLCVFSLVFSLCVLFGSSLLCYLCEFSLCVLCVLFVCSLSVFSLCGLYVCSLWCSFCVYRDAARRADGTTARRNDGATARQKAGTSTLQRKVKGNPANLARRHDGPRHDGATALGPTPRTSYVTLLE